MMDRNTCGFLEDGFCLKTDIDNEADLILLDVSEAFDLEPILYTILKMLECSGGALFILLLCVWESHRFLETILY